MAADLVDMLGYVIDHVGDRPWVSPEDPDAVPLNLVPPLSVATTSKAAPYRDDCHAMPPVRIATPCTYGDRASPVTVALLGDSHAAMYLPALEPIAARRGWRIELLTKSGCPAADLTVLRRDKPYTACDQWRADALRHIRRMRPNMVITTMEAHYELAGLPGDLTSERYYDAWRTGLSDTLRRLGSAAGRVVLLGDVAQFPWKSVACLGAHLDHASACARPRDAAIPPRMTQAYRDAAARTGAMFVDPSWLTCPGTTCPVILGRDLVVYDLSHLTPVWSRRISAGLDALLPDAPRGPSGPRTPSEPVRGAGPGRARARNGPCLRWPSRPWCRPGPGH